MVALLRYEKLNLVALEALGSTQRIGFAWAAAARLAKSYQTFAITTETSASARHCIQARTKVLLSPKHDPTARAEVKAMLTQLAAMMEVSCNSVGQAAALCEDAIAATM